MPTWATLLIAAFGGSLFASGATVATGYLTFSNRDRELDLQLIETSLGILQGEHDPESAQDDSAAVARKFAILTIMRLANTQLTDEEVSTWVDGGQTPFQNTALGHLIDTVALENLRERERAGGIEMPGILFEIINEDGKFRYMSNGTLIHEQTNGTTDYYVDGSRLR
ncbi:hypothetical protein [uncultured Roseobacter sp.]|uniref:hypothetical protein n=1 Tax=uncultured Roseobacter sp. TaxID=114847 RepID=UPI0026321390|nr:hypothetical protein [uncultured Roseobacter sp.]